MPPAPALISSLEIAHTRGLPVPPISPQFGMNQLLKIADNPEIQTGSPFTVVLSKDQIVGEREIMMLNVENHEGLTARFFVSVKVENGRPKVTVTTKPYAGKDEEVSKTVAGSCNLL